MFALPVAKNQPDRIPHRSLTSQRSKTLFINHHVHHTKNEGSHNNEGDSTIAPAQHPHWNFADTPVFALDEQQHPNSDLNVPIQARFKSGESNDPLEHEAESIADHVVGTAVPARSVAHLDRKTMHGGEQLSPTTKSHSRTGKLLRSPGQSLDPGMRTFMESRFGYDFSHVQIHTGSDAARAADQVDALAYTLGQQIVFGAGQYKPGTPEGRRLLAHELTHVVQQSGPRTSGHASLTSTKVTGQAAPGTVQRQRTPRNTLDETATRIINAAKDTSKAADQRAVAAVSDIVRAYYDPALVESVVFKEDLVGLETTPIGRGRDIKGRITVGRDFLDHIDSFARRVLQVGHELEHVKQQREGMGGHNKSHEREFLAFYWESTQPEKTGTGRMPHATRVDLIDEALRNYYCLSSEDKEKYAAKKDELLTLRSSEQRKSGHEHTDPPSTCPSGR